MSSRADRTLTRLRRLLAAGSEPHTALRAVHAFLYEEVGHCSLALLLVREMPPGQFRLAGLIGPDGYEHVSATDPLGLQLRLPTFDDRLARRLVGGDHAIVVQPDAEESTGATARALHSPKALLAMPMLSSEGIEHWFALGSERADAFAELDVDRVLRDATLAYSAVARPIAVREIAQVAERHHRAIEGLADIQRLLQPESEARIRGLDYAVHWQAADTAAGDYYDLMTLTQFIEDFTDRGSDAWGVMLGDVSGHGAASAMEAVQFDAILRTYNGDEPPGGPAGAITYANRHFFSRRQRPHFMTLFSAAHRPDRAELDFVCAGHVPGILLRDGRQQLLGRDNDASIPLGILREHRWGNTTIPFLPGDRLVIYTDGLLEARDARGRMFGLERLQQVLEGDRLDAAATLARVRDAVCEHQGSDIGADDQTLIVLNQTN
ncbi:MAG TPA: PP2C family protein-serine/threonine phosphatase [Xanthomonadales bacterium]|nr:PP2C family protein-serine/threonine phosphatase [Xanthomonadales bacterium]